MISIRESGQKHGVWISIAGRTTERNSPLNYILQAKLTGNLGAEETTEGSAEQNGWRKTNKGIILDELTGMNDSIRLKGGNIRHHHELAAEGVSIISGSRLPGLSIRANCRCYRPCKKNHR